MRITQEQLDKILEMSTEQLCEVAVAIADIRQATDLYAMCIMEEVKRRKITIEIPQYN